ncbi:hypothetical protein BGW80DRAFT_1322063 [Lactifluus volemus]|nr:hypothetical protein BGW80DRAFT_1322063 [Lactifluus volemus]
MASELLYILPSISKFVIQDTLPALQHDFCALWNEIALQAPYRIPISILKGIRHLYLAIHEGTSASPTAFSASTRDRDPIILSSLSSYPSCSITSHLFHPHPVAAAVPPTRRDSSSFPVSTTDHSLIQPVVLPVTQISESSHLFPVNVDSSRSTQPPQLQRMVSPTPMSTSSHPRPTQYLILSPPNATQISVLSLTPRYLGYHFRPFPLQLPPMRFLLIYSPHQAPPHLKRDR